MLVAAFAVLGTVVILGARAAGSFVSVEPENGTLAAGATAATVSGASGGKAVAFSSGGSGTLTCPPLPAFPDANCTGWQHTGVTLKTVPGQLTSGTGWEWDGSPFNYVKVTGSNVTLDGLDISGCVYIDVGVTNVTIKRSRITGNCDYMIRYDLTSSPTVSVM